MRFHTWKFHNMITEHNCSSKIWSCFLSVMSSSVIVFCHDDSASLCLHYLLPLCFLCQPYCCLIHPLCLSFKPWKRGELKIQPFTSQDRAPCLCSRSCYLNVVLLVCHLITYRKLSVGQVPIFEKQVRQPLLCQSLWISYP